MATGGLWRCGIDHNPKARRRDRTKEERGDLSKHQGYRIPHCTDEKKKKGNLSLSLPVRGPPTSTIRVAPTPPPASPPSMEPWYLTPASSLYPGISVLAGQENQVDTTKSHNQSRSIR
ncbi:hypothetical protein U1Q18_014309 [Sarracenia purpurea var. burkii]